ncbi:hypothetical protein G7Y89_g6127 [Cudoniella acicularis]|uniref:Uncharacterized protein n=1 Tax=Cudoniella acicularis TaxID=354080 RepID=A0A8H4W354_9HELO|nr:hypothetical protein G7Y89_g6127 [Cudoniella acicularis]
MHIKSMLFEPYIGVELLFSLTRFQNERICELRLALLAADWCREDWSTYRNRGMLYLPEAIYSRELDEILQEYAMVYPVRRITITRVKYFPSTEAQENDGPDTRKEAPMEDPGFPRSPFCASIGLA